MRQPPHTFCSRVLAWCYKQMENDPKYVEKREEWEYMLEQPLPGDVDRMPTRAELAQENAKFLADAQALTAIGG